jgi:hypothetical protein
MTLIFQNPRGEEIFGWKSGQPSQLHPRRMKLQRTAPVEATAWSACKCAPFHETITQGKAFSR